MEFVSRVEDVFQITDRGCVIAPGINRTTSPNLHVGDELLIKRPDGSQITTTLSGFEMISLTIEGILQRNAKPPDQRFTAILLAPDIMKSQIPVGSELWAVSSCKDL